MAKKKNGKIKTCYVLTDGARYEVTGEDGRFIYCGDIQFRKSAMRGELISETVSETAEETED